MMKTGDLPSTNRGKCCLIFGVLMEIKLSGKRSVILKNNKPEKSSKYYRKCSNNFTAYCNNLRKLLLVLGIHYFYHPMNSGKVSSLSGFSVALRTKSVGSEIIRVLKIIRIKKRIPNAVL